MPQYFVNVKFGPKQVLVKEKKKMNQVLMGEQKLGFEQLFMLILKIL